MLPHDRDNGNESLYALNLVDEACLILEELFPKKSREYLEEVALSWPENDITGLIDKLLGEAEYQNTSTDYRDLDNLTMLTDMFPDVSPAYLQDQVGAIGSISAELEALISQILENKSGIPSRKDYDKVQREEIQLLKIRNMVAEDYLCQYEDPHSYFRETNVVSELYKANTIHCLKSHFPIVTLAMIREVTLKHRNQLVPSFKEVEELAMISSDQDLTREPLKEPETMDIDFFEAYCYLKCESEIRKLQDILRKIREKEFLNATKEGRIFECQICFDEDCLLTEAVFCEKGCMFCRNCG